MSVSVDDLALVLRQVRATRLGGRPTAGTSSDATAAYQRLKATITSHATTKGQP